MHPTPQVYGFHGMVMVIVVLWLFSSPLDSLCGCLSELISAFALGRKGGSYAATRSGASLAIRLRRMA